MDGLTGARAHPVRATVRFGVASGQSEGRPPERTRHHGTESPTVQEMGGGGVGSITVPLFRRDPDPDPDAELRKVPDDLPKDGIFAEPLEISLRAAGPEPVDDGLRVTFLVELRDAEGKRCPDVAVEATVTGPERTATGMGHTDMLGRVRFRMAGPPGTYTIEITDVAGNALQVSSDSRRTLAQTIA